jgi:hypothetical protein
MHMAVTADSHAADRVGSGGAWISMKPGVMEGSSGGTTWPCEAVAATAGYLLASGCGWSSGFSCHEGTGAATGRTVTSGALDGGKR